MYFLLYGFLLGACAFVQVLDVLENTSWELVAFQDKQPISGKRITLIFDNGQVNGTAGCNSYQGEYRVQGDKIVFESIFSTMMACPEPEGVMAREQSFLENLMEVKSFRVIEDRLYLYGSGGDVVFLLSY